MNEAHFSIDYATDCFLAELLGLSKPSFSADYEPFVTTIGYELPVAERRVQAHKQIQRFLNEFKATQVKPITKPKLLSLGVRGEFADAWLADLNSAVVAKGITTEARLSLFLNELCKLTDNLQIVTNWPSSGEACCRADWLMKLAEHWRAKGCNYLADTGADRAISIELGLG